MTVQPSTVHGTFVLDMHYPNPVARVFAAFADPAVKRRWFAEGRSHDVDEFALDFRVGGSERARYRLGSDTPYPGTPLAYDTRFEDIVPERRIVSASTMMLGERRISVSLVTVEFVAAGDGTDLIFTNQSAYFEGADGPQRREDGWRTLFGRLARELAS